MKISKVLLPFFIILLMPYALFADIITSGKSVTVCHVSEVINGDVWYYYRGQDGSLLSYRTAEDKIDNWDKDGGRDEWWNFADKYLKLEIQEDSIEWYNLALWCKDNNLMREYHWLLKEIVKSNKSKYIANPKDTGIVKARALLEQLGYQWVSDFGEYLTLSEEMARRGLRYYKGQWISEKELADIKDNERKQNEFKQKQLRQKQAEDKKKQAANQKAKQPSGRNCYREQEPLGPTIYLGIMR